MSFIKTLLIILLPSILLAQSFPSDATVITDVKKYNSKIEKANVQNEWKLEKEAGYTFSNMAKRVVNATTIKENGVTKKLLGLAIYVRGGAGEKWNFSRFFVTSTESVGITLLTEQEIIDQTVEVLKTNPSRIFGSLDDIAWVYGVSFPDGLKYEVSQRDGDHIYKAILDFERKNVESIPFDGGLYRFKAPFEIYVRMVDNKMKVGGFSIGYAEYMNKTAMNEKSYNALPTLANTPYTELSGADGPKITKIEEPKKGNKFFKVKGL